jgi:diaminohydroxyphosphoribosylaminopyrimidine deaminase / 5-amino-6-(5-phosphoribosylamino)uracil reductase
MQVNERYMRRCIELARYGQMHAAPNPMVGAVIVHGDRIIGEGYHAVCGKGHAEVNAIASVRAADRALLCDSTMYVSLEPCAHYGKTPPCARLIVKTGIPRVVVGCVDPFAKVQGRGIAILREAGGHLLVEINSAYGPGTARLFTAQGLQHVQLRQDTFGLDRMVGGRASMPMG